MAVNESGPRGGIQSLHRAFDIMEAVSAQGSMGTTEIARTVGLAVSTVQNLCRTMATRGYLIGIRGTYRLGPGISVFASHWDPFTALPDLVKPELQRISQETGQSASATVLVGTEARLLAFQPGLGPITIQTPRWNHPDPLSIPTGRVMVALTTQQERWPEFIESVEVPSSGHEPGDWPSTLKTITETAMSTNQHEGTNGQTAIAVPVWGTSETVICAIGCSAPTFQTDQELIRRMVTAVIESSRRISSTLGVDDPRLPDIETAVTALPATT